MYTVAALYHFTHFPDPEVFRPDLLALCESENVRGTILLASEGLNGTIAGTERAVEKVLAHLRGLPGCADLEWKRSQAPEMPFKRMKVRMKAEIVTMGQPNTNPTARVGTYVDPEDWNALIARDDVAVIDTRNTYETMIGSFDGALDPKTETFREFPDWWRDNSERFAGKQIAMFCTGGIRCEKATSWLIGEGVEGVHHLKGGILKYLETVPQDESLWNGECYVFDKRVSVKHGLEPGIHSACAACGRPVSPDAALSPSYREGVSCPSCIDEYSDADRERFAQRQRQFEGLAKARSYPSETD